jgi:hypothetical protein
MTNLSKEDADFLQEILGSDDDDDPIFGKPPPSRPPLPPSLKINGAISGVKPIRQSPRSPSAGSGTRAQSSFPRHSGRPGQAPMKCTHIFVGGTDLPEGHTPDATDPHFCSNLFCISCDFKVIRFRDRKWRDSTDYLFLRNNYPHTVAQNLVMAPKWSAYCCQCTFCSEQTERKLPPFSTNWVCRGHE